MGGEGEEGGGGEEGGAGAGGQSQELFMGLDYIYSIHGIRFDLFMGLD